MKFRKKPVVITARKFTINSMEAVADWCGGSIKGMSLPRKERIMHIQTLEGEMTANLGDWIIKGVKGEFYPCKPDIFHATYEMVDE